MRYFDLHCDTITECYKKGLPLYDNSLAVSVKGAQSFEKWAQVFAVWIPDDLRGDDAWEFFCNCAALLKSETEKNGISLCTNRGGLSSALENGAKRAAILSIEGSAALCGKLENLEKAFSMGVRLMTLTWNGACEAGGGCGDGGGLTAFGRKLVARMNELPMVVDVSHLSDRGFYDVAECSDKVFVATHSDSRTVEGAARNLTDSQFCEIVRRGGIVGLNLFPQFLGSRRMDGILRHVDHFLALGGEKTLAMGCDFDGAAMPKGIKGIADIKKIYKILCKTYGEKVASAIFFDNAANFFETVLTP